MAASPVENHISVGTLEQDCYVVEVGGALDADRADELQTALESLQHLDDAVVALNLTKASFVHPGVIAVLHEAAERLWEGGGELVVATRDPRLRASLQEESRIRVEQSLAEAIGSMPSAPQPNADLATEIGATTHTPAVVVQTPTRGSEGTA